jgi:hypothetical protein
VLFANSADDNTTDGEACEKVSIYRYTLVQNNTGKASKIDFPVIWYRTAVSNANEITMYVMLWVSTAAYITGSSEATLSLEAQLIQGRLARIADKILLP